MGPFASRISKLPPKVRELVEEFRDELFTVLGKKLVGAYLYGSIAFPEYEPRAGDIDFHVVVRKSLTGEDVKGLDRLHRTLAAKFEFGKRLDGFYIPLAKARRSRIPRGLVYGAHGRIHRGGSDDTWALHREHLHASAYIRLQGPSGSRIFPRADWKSIRSALYRQLPYARKIIESDSWWAVLNLCRLVYSFENGRTVISKVGAARWALKRLPSRWRPVIRSAIKTYHGTETSNERAVLKRDSRKFLGFASVRIIAFDSTWDSRRPHIAHLRKRERRAWR